MTALAGKRDELIAILPAGVGEMPGCLSYIVATDPADANAIWITEAWDSKASHDASISQPIFTQSVGVVSTAYTPSRSVSMRKIATNASDGDADLWIWDVARKTPTKFTAGPDADNYPVWTPDSRVVIYRSGPGGGQIDLYRRAADGTGAVERLTESPEAESPQMVLSDGRLLVRQAPNDASAQGTLAFLRPGQPSQTTQQTRQTQQTQQTTLEPVFATPPAPIVSAEVSPDGRWIAYQSEEGSSAACSRGIRSRRKAPYPSARRLISF